MFIFAADIHLSELTFKTCPNARYDSVQSLKCLLELCVRYDCPLVLGGDIWDTAKVSSDLLARVIEVRGQFPDVCIYYINGNHDAVEPSWTSFLENTHRLGAEKVTLPDGETLVGMDYCPPDKFKENFDLLEKGTDYIVVHQYIESKEESKIAQSIPLSAFTGESVILAGDIHQRLVLSSGAVRCIYPGPTNRRAITEPAGACLLVDAGTFTPLDLPSRPLVEKSFEDILTPDMASDILADVPDGAYVVLRAPGFSEEAVRYLQDKAGTQYHLLFRKQAGGKIEYQPVRIQSSNARQYALAALDAMDVEDRVKTLCRSALLDEDTFFERLSEEL